MSEMVVRQRGMAGTGTVRSGRALAALGLGAFTIGTAELLVVGVLSDVGRGFGIPVSTAGLLVTAYAAGIAVGGPLLTAVTIRLPRRALLALALAVYSAGNLLAAAAPDFGILLAARVVTGTVHGLFIGVASAVAAALVPAGRRGRAVAMVFGGIAVATVVGVPLGTLAGRLLGWRAAFAGVVILGGLALSAVMAFVPPVASRASGGIAAQARSALARPVLAMLAFGLVVIGGEFTAFTYLTPYLERVTGVPAGLVSVFLLAYGAAAAAGTFGGGQLADRSPAAAISAATVILAAALGVLLAAGQHPAAVLVALVAWGLAGFGLVPAFQVRVIGLAGRGGDLAATLGASAVNAGIAAGAAAGGWLVAAHGIRGAAAGALACCAAMIPAGAATALLKAPGGAREAKPPPAEPACGRRAS